MDQEKVVYICGPLTELFEEDQARVKALYSKIGDVVREVTGVRAFVPHEHYDPVRHPIFTPAEVDKAERRQVCENTSLLIVFVFAPSWGGGIEVEMAYRSGVPIWLLCNSEMLDAGRISRLLRGNPGVTDIIRYDFFDEITDQIRTKMKNRRKQQPVHV